MKIDTFVRWALTVFLAAACSQEQKSTHKYFDFDRLIDDQISQLSQRMRVLDKEAAMSDVKSDSTFLPSGKGWESELEIFRELEIINKPAYQMAYKVEDPVEDTKSNLKIRQYSSAASPVSLVKFYYQNEFERLRKIEADIVENNLLYTNSRTLVMEFDEVDGKPLLIKYTMNGFQKMVLSDPVRFSVSGAIDW